MEPVTYVDEDGIVCNVPTCSDMTPREKAIWEAAQLEVVKVLYDDIKAVCGYVPRDIVKSLEQFGLNPPSREENDDE